MRPPNRASSQERGARLSKDDFGIDASPALSPLMTLNPTHVMGEQPEADTV